MKSLFSAIALLLAATVSPIRADDSEFRSLKKAVQRREGAITELKARGVFREGADGMLLPSGDVADSQRYLLDEENADRRRLFTLIATLTKKSESEVTAEFARRAAATPRIPVPSPPSAPIATPPSLPPTIPPTSGGSDKPVPNPRTDVLPMKVITRPFASLFREPNGQAPKTQENVPAFTVYYVYTQRPGWYEVGGNNRGAKLGWIKEDDACEWKQNLVVEFTHPEGRNPVLLFDTLEPLKQLISSPVGSRTRKVQDYLKTIASGKIPPGFPVRSQEPKRAVSTRDQFYLLPILDFQEMEIDGREGRLLKLAAATRQRGELGLEKSGADLAKESDVTGRQARQAKVDVVFCMDLTKSMGPFADRTVEMIQRCVQQLGSDPAISSVVRFGFVGYRDFPEMCPGIEFNTRNYTPELQDVNTFANTLKGVKETRIDSVDYEEDVFAGVLDAINSHWREGTIRQIILVGDAPGRAPGKTGVGYPRGPRGTKSGMDVNELRALADSQGVYMTALYLKNPKWEKYAEAGLRQFRTLARNRNTKDGAENVKVLNASDTEAYGNAGDAIADGIVQFVNFTRGKTDQPFAGGADLGTSPTEVSNPEDARRAGRELAANMFRGAMVEWVDARDAATMPRDITTWAVDKDLVSPAIQSLDVKVFLNKAELSNLKTVLSDLLDAGVRGKLSGDAFFKALSAVVTTAGVDPSQIKNAQTLADSGIIPKFLNGLPYRSRVMSMSNESWSVMGPDEQSQFLKTIETKLRFYQLVHDDQKLWIALNPNDDRDQQVAAIPLEQLP